MEGIYSYNNVEKAVHADITITNPVKIPVKNEIERLKPSRPAFVIDIMLFGPGVYAVKNV
jgi:hypothetical protein